MSKGEEVRGKNKLVSAGHKVTGHWSLRNRRVRSVVTAKTLASVKRPDAGSLCDRKLAGCVRSGLTYADVRRIEETLNDRTLGESDRA